MAKFVQLSTPLDTGEEWALVLTTKEARLIQSLVGRVGGEKSVRAVNDVIWFVITRQQGPFLYVSDSRTPLEYDFVGGHNFIEVKEKEIT